ncbi:hypothetical protein [Granulicella mallensis]|nr:hypothetical protein [Granulicella mallensis]
MATPVTINPHMTNASAHNAFILLFEYSFATQRMGRSPFRK